MSRCDLKARDGVDIPCNVWSAEGDAILYMHGLESHMGWFQDMAQRLKMRGLHVYAFDRRGSGLSKEEKGHIDNFKIWMNDIEDIVLLIKRDHPKKKIYLMGICGGGRFAVDYTGYKPGSIDGLILVSPAIKTKVTLTPLKKIEVLLGSFLSPKRRMGIPLRDDMFTTNARYIDYMKADPLKLHYLTARFYKELTLMDLYLGKKINKTNLPMLTVLAGDDKIVDNDAVAAWHNRLAVRDKTIKVFEGTCHFLPFQENLDEIVGYIADWIRERIKN